MLLSISAILRTPLPHPPQESSGPQMSQVGRAGNLGIEGRFCRGEGTVWRNTVLPTPSFPAGIPAL